jgi:hypothetical protein
MNSVLTSTALLGVLIAVILLARKLRCHLPEHHLTTDSKDAVKLAMGLVATMTALLLGLLVSSAKGTYDTQRSEVIQMAAKITFLDRVLLAYGPEASEARARFHETVSDAIRRMWPEGAGGRAQLQPSVKSGDLLYGAIQQLAPKDETQKGLKSQAASLATELGQLRMLLLAQTTPSIPRALLFAVGGWLVIIFFCFGLLAPPNATTALSMAAAALSIAGAVFLLLEFDQPLRGVVRISGEPMINALNQIAR